MKLMYSGNGAPATPIRAPDSVVAEELQLNVGTPTDSAASSLSRIARSPRPIQEVLDEAATATAASASSGHRHEQQLDVVVEERRMGPAAGRCMPGRRRRSSS